MPGGAGMNTLNNNNGGTKLKLTFNRDGNGGGANGMANGAAAGAGSGSGGGSGSVGGMSDDDEE